MLRCVRPQVLQVPSDGMGEIEMCLCYISLRFPDSFSPDPNANSKIQLFLLYSVLFLIATSHGGPMSCIDQNGDEDMSLHDDILPYEQDSTSEILSSTHLFLVEVVSIEEMPWSGGPDGLEHRGLGMDMKLLEVYKGTLDLEPDGVFHLEVEQRRESEFVESDYHGLWSHIEPAVGVQYLVFAIAQTQSPADCMQEDTCQRLYDGERTPEIRLAVEAERVFRDTYENQALEDPELTAMIALIRFGQEHRVTGRDIFGRYLWARVSARFIQDEEHLFPEIQALIAASDAQIDLRTSLIYDTYDAVLFEKSNSEIYIKMLRTFFSLLLQAESEQLHEDLVNIYIYDLAVPAEGRKPRVDRVLPDGEERDRIEIVLSKFDTDRAREVLAWLK